MVKYPGKIPDPQMEDWFSDQASKAGFVPVITGNEKSNPCVQLHGPGPEGERCKNCRLLFSREMSKRFYKCELRGDTRGPGTDHRANWPACGKFERKETHE